MLTHVSYALVLVMGTTLVHVGFTAFVLWRLRRVTESHWSQRNAFNNAILLGMLVLTMSIAALVESALWAGAYVFLEALPDLTDSLYFSLVTYTTLGYGDVTLGDEWRLLAAFQAANGIIIFGWTTALIVAVAHRLLLHQSLDPSAS